MKRIIIVIIITVLICFFIFRTVLNKEEMTIEGLTSDEAIKNVASIYNTDKMSLTNLNVTGEQTVNSLTATKATIPTLTSTSANITNGTITNLSSTNANLSGQLNAGTLADSSMGNVKQYIDNAIENSRISCNWNGWDVVCGACSDSKDDYGLYCSNGKITQIYLINTNGTWGYNGNNYPGSSIPRP